jgi:hypothetical protein
MSYRESNLKELVQKQDKYISLLGEELDELASLATIHGWRSSRVSEGEKLRLEIESLKESLK